MPAQRTLMYLNAMQEHRYIKYGRRNSGEITEILPQAGRYVVPKKPPPTEIRPDAQTNLGDGTKTTANTVTLID